MKKIEYLTPSIEVFRAEPYRLMANTLETENERAPQSAREMDESWEYGWEEEFDDDDDGEFQWDDYHRPGLLDDL